MHQECDLFIWRNNFQEKTNSQVMKEGENLH